MGEALEGDFFEGEEEDFLEGDLRAAEKEARGDDGEEISSRGKSCLSFFSLLDLSSLTFSLSLSFLKMWAS